MMPNEKTKKHLRELATQIAEEKDHHTFTKLVAEFNQLLEEQIRSFSCKFSVGSNCFTVSTTSRITSRRISIAMLSSNRIGRVRSKMALRLSNRNRQGITATRAQGK